jgi:UDP-hydrolysing UDP-N-acetyl-D-glucosamine 2-epimerase
MSKSLGVFLLSITDTLNRIRPDVVLIAGDRGEQLMAALAAAHLNIPVAHIQAGEVSGNIDGQTRHAIARYAHIHFAANQDAADRLARSGEQDFRILNVGAPQLDDFVDGDYLQPAEVYARFHLDPTAPIVLFAQHPVTEQLTEAGDQIEQSLLALKEIGHQTVLIYPNNDAGSALVRAKINQFQAPWLHVERSVARADYAGLMRVASVIVGNSSSGLLEAPTFELPAINIGRRQEGRVQGKNVIQAPHDTNAIAAAIRRAIGPEFRATLKGMANPYGDGRASERIVKALLEIPIDERLLFKKLTY